ncbi:MAG: Gfo/Idh/MocA family oxidoreductase [Clostridia bacterium]|nr:Gfo/Idh/MocA family oxidoreductase [Clostridia bacterium]
MKNNLNIAVIGCSGMAKNHMRGVIAKEGATLYAVCDTAQERLTACREEFSVPVATTDWRELVSDPLIDAVVIVTPDKLHTEMTVAFLRAGKDVLCEKPMALTVAECEEMMRVEKETGRRLMIGQVCRCTPAFLMAKELVASGRIGELFFVESEYAHHYGKARGYDDWRVDPDRHAVIGGGCHAIDLLRWIAGDPEEVYAYANHKSLTDWPVDDCTIAIYRFPGGVSGKVFVSIGCMRDYTMRSVFYGTRGTIICDNTSPTITLYENDPEGGKKFTDPVKLPVEINNHNVVAEIDVFVNALLSGGEMPITSMEGAATVAVACATVEAAREGRPIRISYPTV